MTDKVIRVNVTASKSQKVTVSSSKVANEITASPDTSAYYSRLAKNWAIAEGLVENIDYSSKHYAQESKVSADMAKTYETATQENYNMFMESSVNANSELQTNRDGALADIEGAKTSAVDSLNSVKDENIASIEAKANEALTNIETNRDETLSSIENSRSASVSEITSLSNGYISQINTTGKSYDNLTHRNISNCITEIPQRIKLELADGVLTLKAGSVVTVPNGFEADGTTPKFDYVTIESDVNYGTAIGDTLKRVVFYDTQTATLEIRTTHISGLTPPTSTTDTGIMFYNTKDNTVRKYDKAIASSAKYSFPIASVVADGSYVCGSIDQTFNGMGYIGSTVWVDKGVKGLIPNDKNGDGTYKSIEFEVGELTAFNASYAGSGQYTLRFFIDKDGLNKNKLVCGKNLNWVNKNYIFNSKPTSFDNGYTAIWIKEDTNEIFKTGDGGATYYKFNAYACCDVTLGTTQITSFNPKEAFRAVDYNDSSTVSAWGMPSNKYIDLTLGASGTVYTAPANGWFYIWKEATALGQFAMFTNQTSPISNIMYAPAGNVQCRMILPVKKGDIVKVDYTLTGGTRSFRFIYAEGEV